jgi:ATP-dependent DNA helicase RecQ
LDEAELYCIRGLLSLIDRLSGRFGRTRLAGLANGTDDDARFADLPERGVLRGQSSKYVMDLMRALEGAGLVEVSRGQYPTVAITSRGRQIADGHAEIDAAGLSMPESRTLRRRAKKARSEPTAHWSDDPIDEQLVERLRALRTALASAKAVPPYVIFSNRTLEAIARSRPRTPVQLAEVPGIGPSRLDAYGAEILEVIKEIAVPGGNGAASP